MYRKNKLKAILLTGVSTLAICTTSSYAETKGIITRNNSENA